MDRHSYMLKQYSEQQALNRKLKELWKARVEVDINANGTSGYVVKNGANKDKILAHCSTGYTRNW